jgi:hypothetical protein
VALVLLSTASIGQSRGVEDANLGKWSLIPATFINPGTYHYTILAGKFVKMGGVGLALIIRTGLFVGGVEGFKVIATHFIAGENVSDEFQERGLSDTSLSNKKDGVWRPVLVLW